MKKAIVLAVVLFMSLVFVPGWANETATPVAELITTDVVVDSEPEFLVTTKNENGELVQTPVSELVTEPTEAPKVDSAEPIIPAETTATPVAELVTEPKKPEVPVDSAEPIIPAVTTDTPVAELVVEKEEPTPAPAPKIPAPVLEKPELELPPVIPTPVVEKPELELPIIPAPVVEKPELTIPATPAKEEPKQPEPKTPVNPTPAPKVEEPKLPEPKTPEVPTTTTPEVPTTPVAEEPVVPVAPGATRNHTLRRLPLTGTEESNFTALAAVLTIVAIALAVASMKKEF